MEHHALLGLALAALAGAAAQGATGIGLAVVVAPVCGLLLDGPEVIGTTARLALAVDLGLVARHRTHVDTATLRAYLVPAAAALPPGLLVIRVAPPEFLVLGAGVGSLAATVLLVAVPAPRPATTPAGRRPLRTAGFAAGLLGITTGLSGPPVALDSVRRQLPAVRRAGTLAAFFLSVDLLAVLVNPRAVAWPATTALVGAAGAGLVLGRYVANRVGEVRMRTGVLLVVLASALTAIVQAAR